MHLVDDLINFPYVLFTIGEFRGLKCALLSSCTLVSSAFSVSFMMTVVELLL